MEADLLFRSDPAWLGSDDAYSVPLGDDRMLWLFGDTFVRPRGIAGSRREALLVANTIGIQQGADPSTARMEMFWGCGDDGRPVPFFPSPDGSWLWPLHGVVTGESLLLFFMRVRFAVAGRTDPIDAWRRDGMFSFFDVFGWTALQIVNPRDAPHAWRIEDVASVEGRPVLGASVVVDGEWLLGYAWDRAQRIFLCRWPADSDVGDLQWWSRRGWDAGPGDSVIDEGATEFTIHRTGDGRWMQCQIDPLPVTRLRVRTAPAPHGPWTEEPVSFDPEVSPGVVCYAGKAHPHLAGADVVATYASIAAADATLDDDRIYYPRFIRLTTTETT